MAVTVRRARSSASVTSSTLGARLVARPWNTDTGLLGFSNDWRKQYMRALPTTCWALGFALWALGVGCWVLGVGC